MSGIKRLVIFALLICSVSSFASSSFIVRSVRVRGLQGVSYSTFMTYMPVKVGQRYRPGDGSKIIRALYRTKFFSRVNLYRQGEGLVVKVVERPVIGMIHISGNKKIKTKDLKKILQKAGFIEGQIFDHSVLVQIQQALLQEYYNLGRYNARVDVAVARKVRNRVGVSIKIYEGPIAKIKSIRIIGNTHFTDRQLTKDFSLTKTSLLTWFSGDDQYSRAKLAADLQKLSSYYMDRGYLEFKIDSTQVSITPDRRSVFVVIHVIEGPKYYFSGAGVSGSVGPYKSALMKALDIKPGTVFSRAQVIAVTKKMMTLLGDRGYAFANINPVPRMNRRKHQVYINYVVRLGKRVYVRRVLFSGNTKTADYVLRRESRQMEGGLYSVSKINETKRRLANLGYLSNIETHLQPVSGANNKVDLQYSVKERSSATAGLQVGYSDTEGFIYGGSINDINFLGTGKTVGISSTNSSLSKVVSFNYLDPYFTQNHISFGFNLFGQYVTPGKINMSDYSQDNYGGTINFGYPTSEYSSLNFGLGYNYTKLHVDSGAASQLINFINKYGNTFHQFKLLGGWTYDNLDRAIYPTRGFSNNLSVEFGVPLGSRSISYYKISDEAIYYHPLFKGFVLDLHAFAGYGNGYGKYKELPFFMNYFAGGIGTVRGFEDNTLGPKDSLGNAIGGNISVNGSVGVIFPNPFGEAVRTTAFVDAGNIYQNSLRLTRLRYSAGVQVEWRTPFAPITFSLSTPLKRFKGDQTTVFQFALAASF